MAKQSRRRRSASTQIQRAEKKTASAVKKTTSNLYQPMERMMQAAFMPYAWMNPWMSAAAGSEAPAPKLDVIERNGSVIVRAEVPGVQKSHLEVEASDEAVTIRGEIEEDSREDNDQYRIAETRHGAFERTVRMPSDVDSSRAKATFKDGVLEVMLPKVDHSRSHQVKF